MIWRENDVFSQWRYTIWRSGFNIDTGDFPEQVKGAHVSADYFTVFRHLTRDRPRFQPDRRSPNAQAALISEIFWRSHFGSDTKILTRTSISTLCLPCRRRYTVAVAAKPDAEVWIPLQADPHSINQGHFLQMPRV